uniref:Beta-adaptin appendage C-terminal subdomain domain-containing protein n=1 Tax=Noctiluca scintillans TaxID=2966 RepID=A0A7S1AGJ6_NOCSC
MQTNHIDLKKLVYLYVINYAKAQPDLAILAIHSFRKDANDANNPLLRALAVRTMGCIRLEQMTEYLLEPLRKSCKDPDAYVRKTATLCIAKLFDLNPELVEDQGFIEILRDMLGDANPMVVANAVASLCDISAGARRNYLKLDETTISKLLPALNECMEWGQVFILDALAMYDPPNQRVAEVILERGVIVRLSHANNAVVLSAVKVMMKFMERIQSPEMVRSMCKKMTPPLVTLLSAEPEIQYVVLRNINLIVQKQPQILQQDIRMFVCKYNDPSYVKLEKIAVMVQLASERTIDQVLSEFREYASEVDIECVRRSVRAIGQVAIKLDRAAESCVECLLNLVKTRVNYVVQEAIVVIKDIFRKYPGRYETIITDLCECVDNLDEPEAKASMIWIIGQYADRIDVSSELLETFLETFHEEPSTVQQQLLTATVKLYLKSPQLSHALVQRVMKAATEECNNPDLRDRGYMYWRLLVNVPEMAKTVVLSERPTISDDSFGCQPRVLDRLIENISTLSSVYHQIPEAFIVRSRQVPFREDEEDPEMVDNIAEVRNEMRNRSRAPGEYNEDSDDDSGSGSGSRSSSSSGNGAGPGGSEPPPPLRQLQPVLGEQTPGQNGTAGLRVAANVVRGRGGAVGLQLMVGNFSPQPMGGWAIQFNKSSFGLAPAAPLSIPDVPPNGGTANATLPLVPNQLLSGAPPAHPLGLEVAMKTATDIFYFNVSYDLSAVLSEDNSMSSDAFGKAWQATPNELKLRSMGQMAAKVSVDMVAQRLRSYHSYVVLQREAPPDVDYLYLAASTQIANAKMAIYCELGLQRTSAGVQLVVSSDAPQLTTLYQQFVGEVLRIRWQGT